MASASTRLLRDVTWDLRVEMVLFAVVCCDWNKLESSTADSSLFGNVVSLLKSSLMMEGDRGEFNRRNLSSDRWVMPKLKAQGSWVY